MTTAPRVDEPDSSAYPTTDPDRGLSSADVDARVARGEVNTTDQASSRSVWAIVKANVFTRFNAILGVLFVLVLSTGSLADGVFGGILVFNSAIGIVQEYLAKRKLDQLALLNQPTTHVVRDGELSEIPTAQVVLETWSSCVRATRCPRTAASTPSAGWRSTSRT